MSLSGKAVRYLRSLGHNLEPVVQVGKEGIKPSVIQAIDRALIDHELIKIRLLSEAPVDRQDAADSLSSETGAALVQILGKTILLYRAHPENPKIILPSKNEPTT